MPRLNETLTRKYESSLARKSVPLSLIVLPRGLDVDVRCDNFGLAILFVDFVLNVPLSSRFRFNIFKSRAT